MSRIDKKYKAELQFRFTERTREKDVKREKETSKRKDTEQSNCMHL